MSAFSCDSNIMVSREFIQGMVSLTFDISFWAFFFQWDRLFSEVKMLSWVVATAWIAWKWKLIKRYKMLFELKLSLSNARDARICIMANGSKCQGDILSRHSQLHSHVSRFWMHALAAFHRRFGRDDTAGMIWSLILFDRWYDLISDHYGPG